MVPPKLRSNSTRKDQKELMDHIDEIIALTYSRLDIDRTRDDVTTQYLHQSSKETLDEILYQRLS